MYPGGIPDPDKLGFIPLNAIGHGEDFQEEIEQLCQILQRQSYFVDAEGYEHEIIAATNDAEQKRYAWVEYRSKDLGRQVDVSFTLRATLQNQPLIEWEVETYNPYFGCQVEFLCWLDTHLLFIYHEKHHTYACSFDTQDSAQLIVQPFARHQIADEWLIKDGVLIYRSEELDMVERRALLKLNLIESWTADYARSIDALPPDYDEMNEITRKYKDWKPDDVEINNKPLRGCLGFLRIRR